MSSYISSTNLSTFQPINNHQAVIGWWKYKIVVSGDVVVVEADALEPVVRIVEVVVIMTIVVAVVAEREGRKLSYVTVTCIHY